MPTRELVSAYGYFLAESDRQTSPTDMADPRVLNQGICSR
jgi:hypothetical protein